MPTTCIYSLFNSRGVPSYVAEEARVVCSSIKPLVPPYLRETFTFDSFLTQLAQAWSINTTFFLAFIIGDSLIYYRYNKLQAAV